MKRAVPMAAAVATGLVVLADYFLADPLLDAAGAFVLEGMAVLAACALLLGVANLLHVHARRLADAGSRAPYSALALVALIAVFALGVTHPTTLGWVFTHLYHPLQASMGALLAFFVITAAYRALRLRSVSAAILLITAVVMLVAQMPFASGLTPLLPLARDWLLRIPVAAATRGILLGVALGTIATSLRVLLAVDHPYAQ